jgi:CRISPR-associated protein Cmr6
MGSRTSSGYGRPDFGSDTGESSSIEKISFELWTSGIYGADTTESELRPTAFRGVLRYWFRAIALAMYPPQQAKKLEANLFGAIEPEPTKGSLDLWLEDIEEDLVRNRPPLYWYTGTICLQSKQPEERNLAKNLLQLASHLGGVGRGSRRPLHWNDTPTNNGWRGWRGCYWELSEIPKLRPRPSEWQSLLGEIRNYLLTIEKPESQPANLSPGLPEERRQEVFNQGTHIFFIPCPDLPHPNSIDDWQHPQNQEEIRGEALNLLYHPQFKGVSTNNNGNPHVGGQLGTPSYVTIKSNFAADNSYQTVIVFGFSESRDRKRFCKALIRENEGVCRIKPHEILQNLPSQNA